MGNCWSGEKEMGRKLSQFDNIHKPNLLSDQSRKYIIDDRRSSNMTNNMEKVKQLNVAMNQITRTRGSASTSGSRQFSGGNSFSGGTNSVARSDSSTTSYSQPTQSTNSRGLENTYIALYDYTPRTNEDLAIKKGDLLYVNEDNKQFNDWWKARHKSTGESGYIPAQYVASYGSIESQPWYFGNTKRFEAEKLLLLNLNQHGSFLIRTSDGNNHAYSLSVRDMESVKHYRIRLTDDETYFITKRVQFKSLNELVYHYSNKADGLCYLLVKPCVKIDPPITKGLTHTFMKNFEVDRNFFRLEKRLGHGQFGDVWLAEFTVSKMKVAIKTLKEGMSQTDFKAEAEIMRSIQHPKLIQLYGLCVEKEPIYIVTELMVNGSLLDFLQSPTGKQLKIDTLVYFGAQIADGMAYLESRNFIHRDLAARNVLVGENNEVKVADFGLARVVKDVQNIYAAREGTKFPIKWTAPEAAIYNKFSVKSDVWSFGIVLTEIVTYGRIPYPSMTNQEVLQQVSNNYRMSQPANCPDRLYQIMLNCWKRNPEERPTFESLKYKLENFFEDDESKQYRDTNQQSNGR
jgi:fyn-related kinase